MVSGERPPSRTCRICLDDEATDAAADEREWISPCRCAGTSRWVHRSCLDSWRRAAWLHTHRRVSVTHCNVCHAPYPADELTDAVTREEAAAHPALPWPRVLRAPCLLLGGLLLGLACAVLAWQVWVVPRLSVDISGTPLPPHLESALPVLFDRFDRDASGWLAIDELVNLASASGEATTVAAVEKVVASVNRQQRQLWGYTPAPALPSGALDLPGFVALYRRFGERVAREDVAKLVGLPAASPEAGATHWDGARAGDPGPDL